eukprot:2453476-Prymnesium_polylepis.1
MVSGVISRRLEDLSDRGVRRPLVRVQVLSRAVPPATAHVWDRAWSGRHVPAVTIGVRPVLAQLEVVQAQPTAAARLEAEPMHSERCRERMAPAYLEV